MQINLNLNFPNHGRIPTFLQTVAALGSVPSILWRALEFGASQNRSYFERLSENELPRPHIREMIVRDQAKRFLERMNFPVEDDGSDVTVGNEPLVALTARFGPVQFRILKGKRGIVPGCGDSVARRKFYGQVPLYYLGADRQVRQTKLNLITLWDFDTLFNLGQLWLVCPRCGGTRADDVRWFWHEPLPHPALAAQSASETYTSEDDVDRELDRLLRDEKDQDESSKERA
jgi:hypothetical protein